MALQETVIPQISDNSWRKCIIPKSKQGTINGIPNANNRSQIERDMLSCATSYDNPGAESHCDTASISP